MSFGNFKFILFFSLIVCHVSLADFVLFDDRIDSQQKTEIRYDVPNGCVVTGLGFRAAYDNITTMHCRYHRLLPNGKLTDPQEVQLGSEPNHACEAKVLLPDGWVAVGFGAAGEPEWDVTLLRVWARPLKPDGTLGEMKTFSDGFKPDRGTEREFITPDPDRMMVGAGLRFHHNDIQGVYCRSKRILNLNERNRRNMRGFTGRAWVLDADGIPSLDRLRHDIKEFHVGRIDLRFGKGRLERHDNKAIRVLSEVSASALRQGSQSYAWIGTANNKTMQNLFHRLPHLTGVVVDMAGLGADEQAGDVFRKLYTVCNKAERRLCLRLGEYPDDKITNLVRSLPKDIGLIVPFDEYQFPEHRAAALDTKVYGKRDIIVEIDLTNCPAGPMLPDVRMNNLAGLVLKAASNGAKGFIVHANISDDYVPDTFNAISLYALHLLADDTFQPTDDLWRQISSKRYGAAANEAMAALKLTESTNDLIFRTFGIPVLWDGGKIPLMEEAQNRIKRYLKTASSPAASQALQELLEPTNKTVDLVRQDKETALWLIGQSVKSAEAASKINPAAELRPLPRAMERLQMAVQFWRYAADAYLLAAMYAVDGAPVTRSSAEAALKSLRGLDEQSNEMRDLVSMFKGTDGFIASVEDWLQEHEKTAVLPRNLGRIRELINKRQDEAAVEALDELMRSDRFAPHLSKHNDTVGRMTSSLRSLCTPSNTLQVVRGGDGQWVLQKVAGRWCWATESRRPCIYLDMLAGPLDPPADYVISFEYFDKGDWKIYFHYDSDYPPEQKREYHPVEPLQLTDTGTWKNGSFVLTNCRFASSQNVNADMRFVSGTGACIRNIRLEPR